jgi:glycosyltransferase involved in cell wall biosynthesis
MISDATTTADAANAAGRSSAAAVTERRLAVVVPCFNEAESLPALAAALMRLEQALAGRYETELIFVDDGSGDATHDALTRMYEGRRDVLVVRHATNQGIAAAIATGIANATAEIVASLDADCTYEPVETITALLNRLTNDVEMVVASPYHPAGGVIGVPRWRLALSKAASGCYRLLMRNKLHTYTSCVRVYRKSAVASLPPTLGGFVGIVELLWQLDCRGGRIAESPAILRVRTTGQSKMRLARTVLAHGRLLLKAAGQRLFGFADRRPPAAATIHQLVTRT